MKLQINSIYAATEGEGIHIGTPQIFIRFQGCSIGCLNCDSKETWEFSEHYGMELNRVLERVEALGASFKRVSITGGDPLHPHHVPGVIALASELKRRGYYLNLEASGSRLVHEVMDLMDYISLDCKTPSTGVQTPFAVLEKLVEQYPGRFQIKSVIANPNDFQATFSAYTKLWEATGERPLWVLTPAYTPGETFSKESFQKTLQLNTEAGAPFRVIGQQHKWIFGADRKQV